MHSAEYVLTGIPDRRTDDTVLHDAYAMAATILDEYGRLQGAVAEIIALGDQATRGARLVAVDGTPHVLVDAGRWETLRRAMLDAGADLPGHIPARATVAGGA